jgi:anti-sigma-K factor RskA
MTPHEQFADDLALYALNALEGEDRAALEQHLGACTECRRELEQLRGDGALLALSVTGPKPPQRARQRLMDAVGKEAASESRARAQAQTTGGQRSWWGWLGWAATAAMVVLACLLWRQNAALNRDLGLAARLGAEEQQELEDLRRVAAPIVSPEAQVVTVVALKTQPQPQGKAFYLRNRGSLVFVANNMPPLPPQKAYELWLIPVQGAAIPAGVFKPDSHGRGSIVNPPLPPGTEAKTFAITVENEAGATTPTMPIVMMGAGE